MSELARTGGDPTRSYPSKNQEDLLKPSDSYQRVKRSTESTTAVNSVFVSPKDRRSEQEESTKSSSLVRNMSHEH